MAKILVIDDDEAMRRMVNRVLTGAGHEVVEAADGREGARRFAAERPAILITDIVMPEQEGIETISVIRASGSEVGIIAMSGGGLLNGTVYLNLAEHLGADTMLLKPFRPADLLAAVDELLNRPPKAGA